MRKVVEKFAEIGRGLDAEVFVVRGEADEISAGKLAGLLGCRGLRTPAVAMSALGLLLLVAAVTAIASRETNMRNIVGDGGHAVGRAARPRGLRGRVRVHLQDCSSERAGVQPLIASAPAQERTKPARGDVEPLIEDLKRAGKEKEAQRAVRAVLEPGGKVELCDEAVPSASGQMLPVTVDPFRGKFA